MDGAYYLLLKVTPFVTERHLILKVPPLIRINNFNKKLNFLIFRDKSLVMKPQLSPLFFDRFPFAQRFAFHRLEQLIIQAVITRTDEQQAKKYNAGFDGVRGTVETATVSEFLAGGYHHRANQEQTGGLEE